MKEYHHGDQQVKESSTGVKDSLAATIGEYPGESVDPEEIL